MKRFNSPEDVADSLHGYECPKCKAGATVCRASADKIHISHACLECKKVWLAHYGTVSAIHVHWTDEDIQFMRRQVIADCGEEPEIITSSKVRRALALKEKRRINQAKRRGY